MSPKSRGRPPGRGRSRRSASGRRPTGRAQAAGAVWSEEVTDCWFDEPLPGDRRSWAVPTGHGTYRGLDVELLDPDDEDERTFLLEAQHPDAAPAEHLEMLRGLLGQHRGVAPAESLSAASHYLDLVAEVL